MLKKAIGAAADWLMARFRAVAERVLIDHGAFFRLVAVARLEAFRLATFGLCTRSRCSRLATFRLLACRYLVGTVPGSNGTNAFVSRISCSWKTHAANGTWS